jgi:hypothetical protein
MFRRDSEGATAGGVKNTTKQGGRIKTGHTQPGDRPVTSDQGRCGAIANQPIIFQGEITIKRVQREEHGWHHNSILPGMHGTPPEYTNCYYHL